MTVENQPGSATEVTAQAAEGLLGHNPFIGLDPSDVFATLGQLTREAISTPAHAVEHESALAAALLSILTGKAEIEPAKGDKRFSDAAWQSNPFYHMYLQGYLAWSGGLNRYIDSTSFDDVIKQRARFITSLMTDALSPTNMLLGNPAALKKAVDSGGKSVMDGLSNMMTDIVSHNGMPSQVNMHAFRVGENLGLSKGAVVWKNDVMELIQYAAATAEVHARPLLIVPPQINKFYIFDLAPGKSIVEYLLNSGIQTFIVSWRNPTPAQRHWNMDTYVSSLLDAIEVIRDITGSDDINLSGACVGAITVASLLGYLAAKKRRVVNAVTMNVVVMDIGTESVLGLFATKETIAAAKMNSQRKGVLEGTEMGRVFAWMRPNDLVWNYWVNNYLMGNPPPAFDILYWNNDSTRLSADFHSQLMDVFGDQRLQRAGGMEVLGTPIDLHEVDCDKFVVGGVTDHITPWKGAYRTARVFGGKTKFVLSSSGHIQSLINPPGNPKAKYFEGADLPPDPDAWLASAKQVSGSWWDLWREWLAAQSGAMRSPPTELGNLRHPPGVAAPGTYVIEP
jgi:polyhydroxyalkanoate synthase subunit PhaC